MARENKMVLIEAEDATIATVSVTIQAIQVSKRQMTQSVFRQLPETSLVDETNVRLLGIPWGWVNYRWGDIPESHTNFIFQVGTRLFRDAFRIRSSTDFRQKTYGPQSYLDLGKRWAEEVEALHCARILEGWHPHKDKEKVSHEYWRGNCQSSVFGRKSTREMPTNITVLADGAMDEVIERDKQEHEWRTRSPNIYGNVPKRTPGEIESITRTRVESSIQGIRDTLSKWIIESIGIPVSAGEIEERIRQLERSAEDYFCRWDLLMDQLRGVEQLFIAC